MPRRSSPAVLPSMRRADRSPDKVPDE